MSREPLLGAEQMAYQATDPAALSRASFKKTEALKLQDRDAFASQLFGPRTEPSLALSHVALQWGRFAVRAGSDVLFEGSGASSDAFGEHPLSAAVVRPGLPAGMMLDTFVFRHRVARQTC